MLPLRVSAMARCYGALPSCRSVTAPPVTRRAFSMLLYVDDIERGDDTIAAAADDAAGALTRAATLLMLLVYGHLPRRSASAP